MNKILSIYASKLWSLGLTVLCTVGIMGCSNFLEEFSQDERIPKDVREFSEILYGDAYIKGRALPHEYLDLMTDDVKAAVNLRQTSGQDTRGEARGYFTWQDNPEITTTGALNADHSWLTYYSQILTANILLSKLQTMTGGPSAKAQLEGECYAVRLNAYFMLANLYAPPYDKATADQTAGVPINEKAHAEDTSFPRAKLSENYALMIHDLESALVAFSKSKEPNNVFRWNATAVAILGSRIYLYMKDYDNAIKYATMAIGMNPSILDLNKKAASDPKNETPFLNHLNKEITFSYGFYKSKFFSVENQAYFTASDELLGLFTEGDLRYYNNKGIFINAKRVRVGGSWLNPVYAYFTDIVKSGYDQTARVHGYAIRTVEAYLNRAEAYAELGDIDHAMSDLKKLAMARYTTAGMPAYTPADQQEAIKLVRKERRKELLFEQHRWFDLRRWDQPEITHQYITNLEEETTEPFTLQAKDPRYTLPIPQVARQSDPELGRDGIQ